MGLREKNLLNLTEIKVTTKKTTSTKNVRESNEIPLHNPTMNIHLEEGIIITRKEILKLTVLTILNVLLMEMVTSVLNAEITTPMEIVKITNVLEDKVAQNKGDTNRMTTIAP